MQYPLCVTDVVIVTATDVPRPPTDNARLAEALGRIGVRCEVVSWDDANFPWVQTQLCLIRSTWDYTKRFDEFVRWLRSVDGCTRLSNPLGLMLWNGHKGYLRELQSLGVPIVPTFWLANGRCDQALEWAAGNGWSEVVVKPLISAGALGTVRMPTSELCAQTTAHHVELLMQQRGGAMVQPFLASVAEKGETSLIYFDGALSHAVCKIPRRGDFRVQGQFGGEEHRVEPSAAERKVGAVALAALPEQPLYARVDLLRAADDSPMVIEVELIEPDLFLAHAPEAATDFAQCIAQRLGVLGVGATGGPMPPARTH